MEEETIELINQVMQDISTGRCKPFLWDERHFHYVDEEKKIDLEMVLGNGNYYIRDNVKNRTYVAARKNLAGSLVTQQILIQNSEKCQYINYFVKGDMIGLIKIMYKTKEGVIICNNPEAISNIKSEADFAEYAEEFFREEYQDDYDEEDYDNEENINEVDCINEKFYKENSYENFYEEDENADLYEEGKYEECESLIDYENVTGRSIDNSTTYTPENKSIDDTNNEEEDDISYLLKDDGCTETVFGQGRSNEPDEAWLYEYDDEYDDEYVSEEQDDFYENNFVVIRDGKELEGRGKIEKISKFEVEVIKRHYNLEGVEMFAENLRLTLEDMKKDIEAER